jgi:large exoprotein involved in heme utilization and adhesion
VKIVSQEQGLSLGYEGTERFRDIEFSKKSFVNVTGDGSGSIAIKGKNINFTNESVLLADTRADRNGGDISIVGDFINFNRSAVFSNTFGSGNSGQIKLEANNIKLEKKSGLNIQTWDKGKAGDIIINAKDSLGIEGPGSAFTSQAQENSTGNAGDIIVTVNGPMTVTAGIETNSYGTGKAGTINFKANSLGIENSRISSTVTNARQAGEININVADSLTSKNLTLTTDTSGTGDAGKININANSFRLEEGIVSSQALENSTGKAGEININVAGTLELPQSAGISTTTAGIGNAGDINIEANYFRLEGSYVSSNSQGNSTGNAGKININAGSFRLEGGEGVSSQTLGNSTGQGGEIKITVADSLTINNTDGITTNTSGRGDAGKINITAGSFQLERAGVSSQALENSTGKGGEINITAGTLLSKFASISTTTAGTGDAGKININANSSVLNGSQIFSNTKESGTGNAGEINIRVADLFDLNSATVKTENLGNGNGGDIEIKANNFSLTNGSQVSASTRGKGNAGSVTVNATGNVSADGKYVDEINKKTEKSGFYSTVESSGVGNAGGVNINARSLSLTNGGTISTSNLGSGTAGEIKVTTTKDILLNQGSIEANTKGGQGDISLNSRDLILRNNGKITTNATGKADGGNIKINNTGNLVVFEDRKITANAKEGNGGTVNITARGIFRYPDSITATSDAGPQFNGTVRFNTPDIDPTRGLFELLETIPDPAQQIAQHPCIKGFGSTFTITGRGGLPTDPNKILSGDNVRVDLVQPVASTVSSTSTTQKQPSQKPPVKEIIPARGWIFNEKGEVLLVGYDPTKTGPQRRQPAPTSSCAAVK